MRIEGLTDIGSVRKSNQDACDYGVFDETAAWAVVCDGMGGVNGGHIASAVALEEIKRHITSSYKATMSSNNIKEMLINSINKANIAVYKRAEKEPELRGMGTTAVATVVKGEKLFIVHVGDSRAYLLSNEELERLTVDHSYVQNLINFGQLTESEARVHPKRNIITRAIGVHDEIACDYITANFRKGDTLLMCTDGLTNHIDDEGLFKLMSDNEGKELVDLLIKTAKDEGGSDNITVALIEA